MDYRNADGSVAEMCGNGSRVFAAYLRREGLETADEFAIATRGGVKLVRFEGDLIAVNLGSWRDRGRRAANARRASTPWSRFTAMTRCPA
jgi:diaminopimelate epimerase